ncbi:MAG: hypothetical protein HY023_03875 [Chloroflexi bacterium]|nr:hypothetical protein [Chloroflexota bacterium]
MNERFGERAILPVKAQTDEIHAVGDPGCVPLAEDAAGLRREHGFLNREPRVGWVRLVAEFEFVALKLGAGGGAGDGDDAGDGLPLGGGGQRRRFALGQRREESD